MCTHPTQAGSQNADGHHAGTPREAKTPQGGDGPTQSAVLVGTFRESSASDGRSAFRAGLELTSGWPSEPTVVDVFGPDAPAWLAVGRPGTRTAGRVYAALHLTDGELAVLAPTDPLRSTGADLADGSSWIWSTAQRIPAGGEVPCHIEVSPSGQWVVAAAYASGTLTIASVAPDGLLDETHVVSAPTGGGPVRDKQDGPHLRFTLFLDDDRMLVSDLGTDRLLEYSVQTIVDGIRGRVGTRQPEAGRVVTADPVAFHPLPPGTGPRHLAVLPPAAGLEERIVVVGELDSRLHILGRTDSAGTFVELSSLPTYVDDGAERGADGNSPSHLVAAPDSDVLYVANRGRNTIGVFRVADALHCIGEVDCGGNWPRQMDLVHLRGESGLLVVLERDHAVVHLPLGPEGIPGPPGRRVAVHDPAFVLPYSPVPPADLATPENN